MILLVDNYDSFAHNLARYLRLLGQETLVVRNDAVDFALLDEGHADAIVISPGPCSPNEAGCSLQLIERYHSRIPILGICLGHQAIVQALGGTIVRSSLPMHGRSSPIVHDGLKEFEGLANPCTVGRYHSLVADPEKIPECLVVSAKTEDGMVMAVRHLEYSVFGWQFHPESILTESGFTMLASFLHLANLEAAATPDFSSEKQVADRTVAKDWPERPVTF